MNHLTRLLKTKNLFQTLFAAAAFAAVPARGQATATLSVQVNQPGVVVSSNLFGIFFEEINYGGEGGIYGEMVRNRSFYTATNANYWTLVTTGTATGSMNVDAAMPLSTNLPRSLNLTMASGGGSVGAGNAGFWGMSLQSNATYYLSFHACASNNFSGTVAARLEDTNSGTIFAQTSFSGLTTNWQKFSASLVSSGADTNARLVVSLSQAGTVWLDEVSLFPAATFYNRTNGLRLDLASMLEALHPSFLRFPGGNFIESYTSTNAVRWKKTIGDVAQRPGHMNDSWGYWSTDGFGAEEFFQFCEDLGMQPLYDINAGLMLNYSGAATNTVPISDMGPWVQDAVDLIQYATGATNTTWGAQRAANGHPAPFPMHMMEIGNENGGTYYNARYTLFYDAIKSNYPGVKLISPVWSTQPTSRPIEIQDEHYYSSASTFIGYSTKYDSYSRSGPKVFVGEYAVTSGYGTNGNLSAALGEAAFMTGMERNSDIVTMASYAPLFANLNGIQWHPDLIYYDNARVFGTPSYYVQKLFSNNRGDMVLPTTVISTGMASNSTFHGAIGLGSWNTAVQYTNIVVTSNGVVLYQSDFVNQGTNGWRVYNGAWSTNAGLYQQTSPSTTDCRTTTGGTNWANYTISLRARKVSGSEGFLILFNWTDDNNWTWWNIGGWSNTEDALEQNVGGTKSVISGYVAQTITSNTWYDIRIALTNGSILCYLNNTLVQTNAWNTLYASTTYAKSGGQVIIKAVNPNSTAVSTTFNLAGVGSIASDASVIQLASANATDENSLAAPTYVSPVTNSLSTAGTNFTLTLPAYSLSVLRLTASGINTYSNLLLQVPTPITNGVSVASTVWGQLSGGWINLTANSNHAIVWSSANTNIAVVDVSGNVTGVGPGLTSIIASYPALGLSATQAVTVVYVPVSLVHRYSFSETSGTNVADSVGGAVWNGTLPSGGTLTNGQVLLASNLQQYVRLPAGILSNYSVVTIELWATFPQSLPSACFLFGFGNIVSSSGYNYIFCQPYNGRIAITSASYGSEQNANAGFNFSLQTNLHVTAVFNPPLGYEALYTNGVLAAENSSVTISMSSVSNLFSYIGRSLFSGDSYFDMNLDELRIYNGALSANDIAATQVLGSDQPLSTNRPAITTASGTSGFTLTWPAAASSFTVATTTNLASTNWVPIDCSPEITNGQWQVTVPLGDDTRYYRLQK